MSEKMNITNVFRILLDGGYIKEICMNSRKSAVYKVHVKDSVYEITGHITEKQFNELMGAGLLCSTGEQREDKYGNIYNFYELKKAE